MLHLKSNAPAQGQRTQIEDLSVVGDELSEEQLRGVSGGLRNVPTYIDNGPSQDYWPES